jgi:O-antigen polymerase
MNTTAINRLNILVVLFLACIFILVAPLQMGASMGVVFTHATQWIGWIFVFLVAGIGLIIPFFRGKLIIPRLFKSVSLYLLLVISAAVLANDFNPRVLWEWYAFLAGLVLFLALHQTHIGQRYEQQIYWVILLSGATQAIIGYLQHQGINVFSYDLDGYTFSTNVAAGGFYQVNNFSSYVATTALAPLLLHLPQRKNIALQAILIFILIVMAYSLYLASSRTGLLGLTIGAVLIFVGRRVSENRVKTTYPHRLSGWVWLLSLMTGYVAAYFLNVDVALLHKMANLVDELGKVANLDDPGISARSGLYQGAWNLFLEQPLFGHGLGTFTALFQPVYVATMEQLGNASVVSSITTHPHNELLYRLAESGAMGGLGLILMAAVAAVALWRIPNGQGWLYAGLMFPILLHTQTEYPFYTSLLTWVLFITLLYLMSRHAVCNRNLPFLTRKNRWVGILILCMAMLLSTTYLANKTARSIDLLRAILWIRHDPVKPTIADIKAFLNDNFMDSYFSLPSRRQLLRYQIAWIESSATEAEAADWLEDLHNVERYQPSIGYYHAQIISYIAQNKFHEAWQLIKPTARLYPSYSHQTDAYERIILQKWLLYIATQPTLLKKEDDLPANKAVFNHYVKWMERANVQGILLTDVDYRFAIHSLYQLGETSKGMKMLENSLALYPDSVELNKMRPLHKGLIIAPP